MLGERGVVVSIVDDGLEKENPELKDNYDPQASYDYNSKPLCELKRPSQHPLGNDPDPEPRCSDSINKHGTRCAGVVAGGRDNGRCGTGIAYEARYKSF